MSIAQVRIALRNAYGDHMYRITRAGEIHVYGMLPNSNTKGWWLFGDVSSAETIARIESL